MREALFILLVVGLLIAFTAYKYRRQIRTAREFWRMAKEMRQMTSQMRQPVDEPKEAVLSGNLVNCAKCGTWVPEEKAVRLGRTSVFCSARCLERSAQSV